MYIRTYSVYTYVAGRVDTRKVEVKLHCRTIIEYAPRYVTRRIEAWILATQDPRFNPGNSLSRRDNLLSNIFTIPSSFVFCHICVVRTAICLFPRSRRRIYKIEADKLFAPFYFEYYSIIRKTDLNFNSLLFSFLFHFIFEWLFKQERFHSIFVRRSIVKEI